MDLITLTTILAFLLVFGIVMYAVLDGFDLGIGNTFLFFKPEHRGKLMDTIAPVWDGNETWLIYVGTIGVAAFPIVYYGLLPALYIPAVLMVAGLFIRGMSFELRLKAQGEDKKIWDFTFFLGSFLASFLQGVLFAAAFTGINIKDGMYHGKALDFITPFNLTAGALTVIVYSILGLGFIRYKTEGEIAQKAIKLIKPLIVVSFVSTFLVEFKLFNTIYQIKNQIMEESIRIYLYSVISIVSVVVFYLSLKSLKQAGHTVKTFVFVVSLFLLSLVKKVVMFFPYIILPNYTIFDAANAEPALRLTFILLAIFLPIVLCYTAFVYYTFKGKVQSKDQYYS